MDFLLLNDFKNIFDIRYLPFTSRGSRLSISQNDKGIALRLTDRLRSQDMVSQISSNLPSLIEEIKLLDRDGDSLEYKIETYPHCLIFDTKIGKFYLTFEDAESFVISLPEEACGICGKINLNEMVTDRRGAIGTSQGQDRTRLVYTTNRKIIRHHVEKLAATVWNFELIVEGGSCGGILFHVSTRLGLTRYINDPKVILNRSAQMWQDWFSRIPKIGTADEKYSIAWWVLGSGLVSTRFYLSREVLVSSKRNSTTIWQWDACLYAVAYRHVDRKLAQDQLRVFFDHQAPNGMIPDGIYENGVILKRGQSGEVDWAYPPLMAWAAWKLYERDGDIEFLNEIYDGLSRWLRWWSNLSTQGLTLTSLPKHALFAEDMDDPVFFEEIPGNVSPELSVFLYVQFDCMAKISLAVGENEDADYWTSESQRILSSIQGDEDANKDGLFWVQQQGRPVCVPTPLSLVDLLSGDRESETVRKLLEHLCDEDGFWKNFPLPTVLLGDDSLGFEKLWRSPLWISMFYILLEGLDRCNCSQIGDRLCRRLLDLLNNRYSDYARTFHAPIYSWAAALYIELAIRAAHSQVD